MQPALPTAILLFVFSKAASLAGISAPSSSAYLSMDGRRLLVMVSPAAEYEKRHPSKFTLPDGRSITLNETFPKSGSYDSATFAPLWQVDWFSLKGDLLFSADFTDVARLNRFGLDSDWALAFYHEGRLTRRYNCAELLTGLKNRLFFPYETWDWHYAWYDGFELSKDRLAVSTARRQLHFFGYDLNLGLQEFYTFDLPTGAVISRSSVGWWCFRWYGAGIVFICSVVFLRFWVRRRSRISNERSA